PRLTDLTLGHTRNVHSFVPYNPYLLPHQLAPKHTTKATHSSLLPKPKIHHNDLTSQPRNITTKNPTPTSFKTSKPKIN
ncbi:unnamed protein product, partial [Dovyalis caffra]